MIKGNIITHCAECGAEIDLRYPSLLKERNFCNRSCLGRYRSKHWIGDQAANWKGGVRQDRERVMVLQPESPMATSRGYVYRYRLIASAALGRALRPNEIVHHIDGDESNDDPSNLIVMTQSDHARLFDARKPVTGAIPSHCGNGHALTEENLYR